MGTVSAVAGALVGIALVAAVTVLTWHGTIDGQAAIGFFSGVSLAGVIGGVQHSAIKIGAKAATNNLD